MQELELSQTNYARLQQQLAESQQAQLELSESLLLLQQRAERCSDHATSMSPVSAADQVNSAAQQELEDTKHLLATLVGS